MNRLPKLLDERSIVRGYIARGGIRTSENIGGESLRGLHRAQGGPVRRPRHISVDIDLFDGVCNGHSGNHGRAAIMQFGHNAGDHARRGKRTCGVMHQNPVRRIDSGKTGAHRIGAFGTSEHNGGQPPDQRLRLVHTIGANHDNYFVDDPGRTQAVDAMLK